MPRITRDKLNKIIQEELKEARIEEGVFRDLSNIGRDIKKYFKNVRQRGAEEIGDEEQLQLQQSYINGLKAFRDNRAEAAKKHPESAKIQRQLAAADTAISVLQRAPTSRAAEETRDAIGAGVGLNVDVDTSAEAEMEAEIEKTYRRQGKKMPSRGDVSQLANADNVEEYSKIYKLLAKQTKKLDQWDKIEQAIEKKEDLTKVAQMISGFNSKNPALHRSKFIELVKAQTGEAGGKKDPPPVPVQAAAIRDPAEVLKLVINFLNDPESGGLIRSPRKTVKTLNDEKMLKRLSAKFREYIKDKDLWVGGGGAMDENKLKNIRVTKTALREAVRLIQKNEP